MFAAAVALSLSPVGPVSQTLLDTLTRAGEVVREASGLSTDVRVAVVEFRSALEFYETFGADAPFAAVCRADTLYFPPADFLVRRKMLTIAAVHEVFHAAARPLDLPRWVEEGAAFLVSGADPSSAREGDWEAEAALRLKRRLSGMTLADFLAGGVY